MFLANKLNKGGSLSSPDAQFNYVTMLLHGDGTNGAQNNTFLDSSTNNFTITRNGNTTQGSFSPYGSNWSNYFDGNGDYLTAANNTALDVGTGAFTIEGWIYRDGTGDTDWRIVAGSVSSAGFFGGRGTLSLGFGRSAVAWDLESASNVYSLNTWTHVVYVRNGSGNLAIFANGTRVATTTNSNNYGLNGGLIEVGAEGANQYFGGYISNVRVVKGSAVYDPTASTLTVPTTPLTAVSGTGLLTCQSNRFKDNSTNNFTLTVNGNTSVQRFNPFGASTAYSTSVIGGSAYYDGTGDSLSTPASSANIPQSGDDYTVEAWIYLTAVGNVTSIYSGDGSGYFAYRSVGRFEFVSGALELRLTYTAPLNRWCHVAVTRQSGTVRMFVDGVLTSPTAVSGTVTGNTDVLITGTTYYFGSYTDSTSGPFYGYISNFRIVKGTAVYTAAFTPPTAPLTAVTNTAILLNNTNGAIYDNAMMNDLETVGNAQISTSVKKYGTGSLKFDGTGDYLTTTNSPNLNFGSGNFTIELWLYSTVGTSNESVVNKGYNNAGNLSYLLFLDSNTLGFFASSNGTSFDIASNVSMGTATQNTWVHFAASRSGSSIRLFRNGTLINTVTSSATIYTGTTNLYIGSSDSGGLNFNGYIDDLRITKGYARYTANFTPPTQALSDTGP